MPSKNPTQRLCDIIENIDAIRTFVTGLDFGAFCADRKTVYAVVRALEIISEASRRLPEELLRRHAAMDWAAIAASGNVYRHEYEAVDEALVWQTVEYSLESLRAICREELARSTEGQAGLLR